MMAMAIELRTLTTDDWALWRELRLAALADAPDMFGATLAEWTGDGDREDRWRARLAIPGGRDFVAVLDHEPVGMVSGVPSENDSSTATLISMWVSPRARGRGVGDALVGAVIAWAREGGYQRLALDVREHNSAAINLYERMGFTPVPAQEGSACERSYALELTGR